MRAKSGKTINRREKKFNFPPVYSFPAPAALGISPAKSLSLN
jgi:hypothetical protein